MSSDFSAEITAIATVVLAVGAIITAIFAIRAFREQARMLKMQSDQLDEQREVNAEQTKVFELQKDELSASLKEREREADERRRAQASHVFISAEPYRPEAEPISVISVIVRNTSQQPIYYLRLLWPNETGEWFDIGDPVDASVLMPGEQHD